MANIPMYSRQFETPKELNAPKQSARIPEGAFGGTQAKQIGQVGRDLEKLSIFASRQIEKVNDKRDDAWVSENLAKFTIENNKDYTDNVLSQKGGASVGGASKFAERTNKLVEKYSEGAISENALDAFKNRVVAITASSIKTASGYEQRELEKWVTNSALSNASVAVSSVSSMYKQDADDIDIAMRGRVSQALEKVSEATGTPVDVLMIETKKKIYGNIINSHLGDGSTEKAKTYLERYSKDLEPKVRTAFKAKIRAEEIEVKSYAIASKAYVELDLGKITEIQIREQVADIKDDDLRIATQRKIRIFRSQHLYDTSIRTSDGINVVVTDIEGMKGNLIEQEAYVNKLARVTPVEKKVHKAAETYLNRIKGNGGIDPGSSAAAVYEAREKIIKAEITRPDQLGQYAASITQSDLKGLVKELEGKQEYNSKDMKVAYTNVMGIDGGVKAVFSKSEKEVYGEFLKYATSRLKETNLSQKEGQLEQLAATWARTGERKGGFGWGYGADTTYSEAVMNGTDADWLPVLDAKAKADITEQFRNNNEVRMQMELVYGKENAMRGYAKEVMINRGLLPKTQTKMGQLPVRHKIQTPMLTPKAGTN